MAKDYLDYPVLLDNLFISKHTIPPKYIQKNTNLLEFALSLKPEDLGWYYSNWASNNIGGLPDNYNSAFVALITSYHPTKSYRTILLFPYARNEILYNTNHSDGLQGETINWSGWFTVNMSKI
ncbi:MAG: hypothetical protein SO183_07360 [Fusobacterium mortiferum]|nr:hypothetical protein [Fusobacterium mortiferum]